LNQLTNLPTPFFENFLLGESLRVRLYVPAFFALRGKKELHCDPFRKAVQNVEVDTTKD
jgi:hypothetical protein